jgi:mono/diheme cytochrome c family protein
MLSLPFLKKNLGAPLQSRRAMLETLFRHLDMVRLSAGAILMVAAAGCTGLIDGGSDGLSNEQRDAETQWEQNAYPVLSTTCGVCHAGQRANVGFLIGGNPTDVKATLLAYQPPVVNFDAPGSSRLLSKGLHDGPELTGDQTSTILQWLQAEKDAQDHDPTNPTIVYQVDPFTVQMCTGGDPDNAAGTCPTNHISLSTIAGLGPMVPNAEISFTAQAIAGLYLSNMTISGGDAGVYLEHPLFVSKPAMGDLYPDQIDRFFADKDDVGPGMNQPLGGGTAVFAGFDPANQVEIHFKLASAYKPMTGTTTSDGTCKQLTSFTTNAAPQLTKAFASANNQSCFSCHGGANAGAKAALDMTGVDKVADATMQGLSCAQVKSQINLTTTDMSGFYVAPGPGSNHPIHLSTADFTSFKTPVDLWVQAEKTSP